MQISDIGASQKFVDICAANSIFIWEELRISVLSFMPIEDYDIYFDLCYVFALCESGKISPQTIADNEALGVNKVNLLSEGKVKFDQEMDQEQRRKSKAFDKAKKARKKVDRKERRKRNRKAR